MHYFRRSRSGQVHSFMAALNCLRSVETSLTLTCPSPKSFACNLPDSGRHVTSVSQVLSLSLSLSLRGAGGREPWERGCACGKLRMNKNRRQAIFNWAAKGLFFLKGGGGYTHSGYHKTLSATIACDRISCETET